MRRAAPVLLILLLAAGTAFPQRSPERRSANSKRAGAPKPSGTDTPKELLPTETGVLRGVSSKKLYMETPEGNTLEFYCSKKTTYWDGSKKIKSSVLKVGDTVSVETRRELDGTLDAIAVHLEHPKT